MCGTPRIPWCFSSIDALEPCWSALGHCWKENFKTVHIQPEFKGAGWTQTRCRIPWVLNTFCHTAEPSQSPHKSTLFAFAFLPCLLPHSYPVSKAHRCLMHISCFYPFFSSHSQVSHYFYLSNLLLPPASLSTLSPLCLFQSNFLLPANLVLSVFIKGLWWLTITIAGTPCHGHLSSWPSYTIHPPDFPDQQNAANVAVLTCRVPQPAVDLRLCLLPFVPSLESPSQVS